MPVNPYIYKGPLDPVKDKLVLVPRTNLFKELKEGIKKGEYWVVLGSRQNGKTTLLRQIKNKIKNAHHVFISFQLAPANEKNFYQWLMEKFLEQIPSENGHKLTKKWKKYAPHIRFVNFLENLTTTDNKKKIILLFDEIEGIDFLANFLSVLRKIYQDRLDKKAFNRYSVVITSAKNLLSYTEGTNTLFNIAETFYLSDFSGEESEKLIDGPFKRLNRKIEQKAKEKLISQVGGHPQLLQHACYNLVETAVKEKREIVEADVDDAVEVLLKTNITIDTLRLDIKGNQELEQLIRKIFSGKKEEYHLNKAFTIIGAGSIVEDEDSHCAIRNKVYERFLADYLNIPRREKISFSKKRFEFIEKDSTTRFEVIDEIGKGGRGIVYKAEDKKLDRMVAIKQLNENAENKDKFNELIEEARTIAKLDHENIVRIFDIKKVKNGHIIIMEFVEGKDYDQIIREKGPLTIKETLQVAKNLFEALEYSHNNGIIHKDIKPKNIMKDQSNKIKIVDFGIAAIGAETGQSNTRYIMGSPCCISPEQVTSEEIDQRSDIYSAGATLFLLVTGLPPFKGRSLNDTFRMHVFDPPPSVHKFRSDVPPQLAEFIEKCIQKEKKDRFQSAADALREIEACILNQGASGHRPSKKMPGEIDIKADMKKYLNNTSKESGTKTVHIAGRNNLKEKPVKQKSKQSKSKTR
jgi:serine/threonine protein kinase/energy-coupling factor transporter ATP-binding protein EcfA2